jgi:hypothetical protein
MEKKIKPEDKQIQFYWAVPLPSNDVNSSDFEGIVHSKRSTIGLTRTRTLRELSETGIISTLTFEDAQSGLKDSSIVTEGALISYLLEREYYYSNYSFSKAKELQFSDTLLSLDY